MKRKSLSEFNCSWAQAAEAIGDKWSIMIIRDALYGIKAFSTFEKDLGISKNILTARLEHLIEHGVMEKVQSAPNSPRFAYALTNKGRALLPVIVAIGQWGDQWIFGEDNKPIVLKDKKTNDMLKNLEVTTINDRRLELEDICVDIGPGATESTRSLIEQINKRR